MGVLREGCSVKGFVCLALRPPRPSGSGRGRKDPSVERRDSENRVPR